MKTVTLSAHVDGDAIRLDEPFDLPSGAKVLVTLLPPESLSDENAWRAFSKQQLARAYSDDEPDYPASLILRDSK